MKPYQRENSGPQQQQQQPQLQQQQGVMQNPNNHRFTPNQQLQQQQIQQHQQQQHQQQIQQQQQQHNQQQNAQNIHEQAPLRVNTSQGGAIATQGQTSMYTGPSGPTQGVFPSKPPGTISMSGNQGQPRPQSSCL